MNWPRYLLCLACFCLVLHGCSRGTEVSREPIGKVLSAAVIPGSFNEQLKMEVTTERKLVVIHGIRSISIGAEAWCVTSSNGRTYLVIAGSPVMFVCY